MDSSKVTPSFARSRITNGRQLLPDVDGRSAWARLFRDTFDGLMVHCGGESHASEPDRMTARRAAALESELIFLESKFAQLRAGNAEPTAADLDLYSRLSNTQRRQFEALGMKRRVRDVTPDPLQYARAKAAAA